MLPTSTPVSTPSIKWNHLADNPTCKWHESTKVRRVALIVFSLLAAASLATTVYTAFFFIAAPVTIITLFSISAGATLAFTITTICFAVLKLSPKCPEQLLKKKKEAQKEWESGSTTAAVRQKYADVITIGELNDLVRSDAKVMNYPDFVRKHGEIFANLDEVNKKQIKNKHMHHLQIEKWKLGEIVAKYPGRFTIEELTEIVRKDAENLEYREFIEKHGLINIRSLPCILEILQPKFTLYLHQEMVAYQVAHPQARGHSLESLYEGTKHHPFKIDLDQLNECLKIDTYDYTQFVHKYGSNSVNILNEANKQNLRPSFFRFVLEECIPGNVMRREEILEMGRPFNLLKSEFYPQLANSQAALFQTAKNGFSDFDGELIDWITDFAGKQYIQARYREHILDMKVGIVQFERIHQKRALFDPPFVQSLKEAILARELLSFERGECLFSQLFIRNGAESLRAWLSSPELSDRARKMPLNEIRIFQGHQQEVFLPITDFRPYLLIRWKSASLVDPQFPDRNGFYLSIGKEFAAHEWTSKALEDTKELTVRQIVQQHGQLFRLKILTKESRLADSVILDEGALIASPEHSSIEQRIAGELTQFNDPFTLFVLENKLFDKRSEKIIGLVRAFVLMNFDFYVLGQGQESRYTAFIHEHGLMPEALLQHIEVRRKDYAQYDGAYNRVKHEVDARCIKRLQDIETRAKEADEQAEREADIQGKEGVVNALMSQSRGAIAEVSTLRDLQRKWQSEKEQIERQHLANKMAINELHRKRISFTADDRARLEGLSHEIPLANTQVISRKSVYDKMIAPRKEESRAKLDLLERQIKVLTERQREIQKSKELRTNLEKQKAVIEASAPQNGEEATLRKTVNDSLKVQGFGAALSAMSNKAEANKRLSAIKEYNRIFTELTEKLNQMPSLSEMSTQLQEIPGQIHQIDSQIKTIKRTLEEARREADQLTDMQRCKERLLGLRLEQDTLQNKQKKAHDLETEVQAMLAKELDLMNKQNEVERELNRLSSEISQKSEEEQRFREELGEAQRNLNDSIHTLQQAKKSHASELTDKKDKLRVKKEATELENQKIFNNYITRIRAAYRNYPIEHLPEAIGM